MVLVQETEEGKAIQRSQSQMPMSPEESDFDVRLKLCCNMSDSLL